MKKILLAAGSIAAALTLAFTAACTDNSAVKYTVSFDSMGGSAVEAQQVRIIAEAYNDQWGMSMTEFGVYGEEITGEAASTVSVAEQGSGVYHVEVGLEHIYQKYRNAMISFTYDPAKMTLQKEPAALNDASLLKTGEAVEADIEDGTKTVTFTYGIKDQAAFKEAAQARNMNFWSSSARTTIIHTMSP